MFDNLREDASSLSEEDSSELFPDDVDDSSLDTPSKKTGGKLLGMTAIQRFIIATMLMVAICVIGMMCLLITGKIGLA